MRPALTVLVSGDCASCAQSLALVEAFARARPDVDVRVVDVDTHRVPLPAGFAGTPMFYRGDTVVSCGNPTAQDLLAAFAEDGRERDD